MHRNNKKHKLNTFTLDKLNLLYLNINSIRNKIDEIEFIIAQNPKKIIHFIALTEIRIPIENNKFFHIPNYNVYFNNRNCGDGGVALYVHVSIQSTLSTTECHQNINYLSVNLNKLKFNVAVIYKKPTVTNNIFYEFMENKISKIKKTILIGDTNTDLLNNKNNDYMQLIESNGYEILNKINKKYATRVKTNKHKNETRTIIDHIITDIHEYKYTISINNTDLSDHKQILINIDNNKPLENKFTNNKIEINRNITDQNILTGLINNADLSNIHNFEQFENTLIDLKQKSTKRLIFTKIVNPFKPWVDKNLIKKISDRNRYFKLIKNHPTNEYLQQKHKQLTEEIKTENRTKRNNYNAHKINTNMSNPKKMWSALTEILYNKNNNENKTIQSIANIDNGNNIINNEIINNPTEIANVINKYFGNVGKNLYEQIENTDTAETNTNTRINNSTIYLREATIREITIIIKNLKTSNNKKDIISANELKTNITALAPVITKLINNCFTNEIFPQTLKKSRIVPIYKDGNPLDPSNYRPINILSSLSKIIETALYDRIENFIRKHKIINDNQYGFQKKSGTLSATIELIEHIQNRLDKTKNNIIGCTFIDLKKAFDTIPHNILYNKLHKYGIRGRTLNILKSYFTNRSHYTDNNNNHSQIFQNNNPYSVQQGSNLGPLLFILYINDIFDIELHGKIILFADDAILIYDNTNIDDLRKNMQSDIDKIFKWFTQNKLSMNIKKTKTMIITCKNTDRNSKLKLNIKNTEIEQVNNYKYLGLTIQNDLKWNTHINNIKRKVSAMSGVISRLGNKLNNSTLKTIYYSYINSQIAYLIPIWGTSSPKYLLQNLQITQNNSIRRIFHIDYHIHNISTNQIYTQNKILKIEQLIEQNLATLIHKIRGCNIKSNVKINYINERRNHNTRQSNQIVTPTYRTSVGKNSIIRTATITYNKYINLIDSNCTLQTYKQKIKHKILGI